MKMTKQSGLKNAVQHVTKQGQTNNTVQTQNKMPWPSLGAPRFPLPKWPVNKPNTTVPNAGSTSTVTGSAAANISAFKANPTPVIKKKSGFDQFREDAGNVIGGGAEKYIKGVTKVFSGGTKLASDGVGSAVGLVSPDTGNKIKSVGEEASKNISEFGNEYGEFYGDTVYGGISGTPKNDQNQRDKVMQSKYISSYNGQTVLRMNIDGRPGSLGPLMMLGTNQSEEMLKHESGHYEQYKELSKSSGPIMGPLKYLAGVGYPSFVNGDYGGKNYYEQPWEVSADIKGGVDTTKRANADEQSYAPGSEEQGEKYFNYLNSVQTPKDYIDFFKNLGNISNHDMSIVDEKLSEPPKTPKKIGLLDPYIFGPIMPHAIGGSVK